VRGLKAVIKSPGPSGHDQSENLYNDKMHRMLSAENHMLEFLLW